MEWITNSLEHHNVEFIILLLLLLSFGLMRQNEGERLIVFIRSFVNPSLINQQLRQERAFNRIAVPLFITIVFSLSFFIALILEQLGLFTTFSFLHRLLLLSGVLIIITLIRAAVYYFFGSLFDLRSALQSHTTQWLLNNFILALLSLPLAVLLAFGPEGIAYPTSIAGLFLLGVFYLIRTVRLFGLAQQEMHVPMLYNVLYLCALEILPPILIAVAISRAAG